MKNYLCITKIYLYLFLVSFLIGQSSSFRNKLYPGIPELERLYIIDQEDSLALMMEFSNSNFEYIANETLTPPSLTILFNNVKWDRGNFSKKSDQSPLYQYSLQILSNANQKEEKEKIKIKMDFTRVPEYRIQMIPAKGNGQHIFKISWSKNSPKKKISKYQNISQRLPESRISINLQDAKLDNALRILVSQDNLNLIMGDNIDGRVTVNLEDVSLETALDAILYVNNYDWFVQDNIIIVQPMTSKKTLSGELLTRMFRLNYINGNMASDAVREVLSPRGKIRAISSTASANFEPGEKDIVIVTDLPDNFDLIDGVIKSLDVESDQINIAVKFVETSLRHNEVLGINWELREEMHLDKNLDTDSLKLLDLGLKGQTINFATLSRPNASALLSLLANDKSTKLIQDPQITTENNSPARVFIGKSIPVPGPRRKASTNSDNSYIYEDKQVNVSLDVLPRVNNSDVIRMKIDASVQELIGFVGHDQRPMVSTRSTNTRVRVNNGETLLIGGMIFNSADELNSKVRLLESLPLIKQLINYKGKYRKQRQLLIFITPNIVRSDI